MLFRSYVARDMKPMWENREAVRAFQQQLAEVAIAGFQPQFTTWVELLTDPAVTGQARDVVLSDAMMGYLQFVAGISVNGNRWLYSSKPYKLATPALSVINQWQLSLDNGELPRFIASLAPAHPQYATMHQSLLELVADSRPWPQLRGTTTLRPGQWSSDVPAIREIMKRSGILDSGPKIALPGDETQNAVVSPSAPVKEKTAVALSNKPAAYDRELVAAVKQFQAAQGLGADGVDKYIAAMMHETNVSPLLMAWSIAAVLRIALGSATVAAITAGGIVAPLIATTGVSPELMVIAVGSGSVIFSHVNDPGFWLFKEYFNLTIGETIKSWSALETIISVCGLVGVLLLNMVV